MHVPGHMISGGPEVIAAVSASAAIAVSRSGSPNRCSTEWREAQTTLLRRPELLGAQMATAALVFALQMVNFPVLPGTSGHLLGGALATALIGPRRALLAVSAVVVTQSLLFADGGIDAMGVNLWFIALIPVGVAVVLRRLLSRRNGGPARPQWHWVCAAALLGPVVSASLLSGLYAVSATTPVGFGEFGGSMVAVHSFIGVGEALLTVCVLFVIQALTRSSDTASVWITALLAGVGLSMVASSQPDGLTRIMAEMDIQVGASGSVLSGGPLANYAVAGLDGVASASLAALIGLGAAASLVAVGVAGSRSLTGRHVRDGGARTVLAP